jgi:hypothetical protein
MDVSGPFVMGARRRATSSGAAELAGVKGHIRLEARTFPTVGLGGSADRCRPAARFIREHGGQVNLGHGPDPRR